MNVILSTGKIENLHSHICRQYLENPILFALPISKFIERVEIDFIYILFLSLEDIYAKVLTAKDLPKIKLVAKAFKKELPRPFRLVISELELVEVWLKQMQRPNQKIVNVGSLPPSLN